ncbi:acyltransferase [Xanthobacter wiegelii]|uniref:acyltransferase n=1 Tax=Xanthobacter wiegelii TaxID=3119913 RepID=UPI00372AD696
MSASFGSVPPEGSLRSIAKVVHRTYSRAKARISWIIWSYRLGALGEGSRIYRRAEIHRARMIRLGRHVVINDFVHIWGEGGVEIGDHSMLAAHTVLTTQTHDARALRLGLTYDKTMIKQPVCIGRNVWVGSNAVILPGVTIGDNSIVGAGAVVTRDVPPNVVVVGIPARTIREL